LLYVYRNNQGYFLVSPKKAQQLDLMQEKGLNSTFKKIIYESSEMVFLADDSYPYHIFYANESFEDLIGQTLTDRTLGGLGLDITAYIFKEELILTHDKKDYSFKLELPQDSGSNYFLFYKGKEIKTHGLPSKKEANQFFSSKLDLIAFGKFDHLTYLNSSVSSILGYEAAELLNTNLCPFIHEEDLKDVQSLWKSNQKTQEVVFCEIRFLGKDGRYRHLECSVQFNPDTFFVIARDISHRVASRNNEKMLESLRSKTPELTKSGNWKLDLKGRVLALEPAAEEILKSLLGQRYAFEEVQTAFYHQINSANSKRIASQNEITGVIQLMSGDSVGYSAFLPESPSDAVLGVIWDDSKSRALQSRLEMHQMLWMDSPEAMLIVDQDGGIYQANREFFELFGLEKTDRLYHLDELNVFFEEANQWMEWVNSPAGDTSISRFSTLLINEKGKQLTLEIAAKRTSVNQTNYIILSFRNISEKISLEKKVEASSNFLMNLTEQVPGGLYQLVLNSEGQMNFSFLSKGINSVLGVSPEEVHQFTDISAAISKVHPQDLPLVVMSSVASAKKMEPWQCQFRVKSGDKGQDYRWVLGAARPQSL
jgi:PAS domain S-box-containing protein